MNKTELIEAVARETGIRGEIVAVTLNAAVEKVVERLATGEKVHVAGFGTFEIHTRVAYRGHNPMTGEDIDLPARRSAKFRASQGLKRRIQNTQRT